MRSRSLPTASIVAISISVWLVSGTVVPAAAQQESVLLNFNNAGAGGASP